VSAQPQQPGSTAAPAQAGAAAAGLAPQPVTFRARDERALAGLLSEGTQARGALVVNGATGFPREFYLKFAAYCAQRGYHAWCTTTAAWERPRTRRSAPTPRA